MSLRRKGVSILLGARRTRANNVLHLCWYVAIFVLESGHKRLSVWLDLLLSLLRRGVFL